MSRPDQQLATAKQYLLGKLSDEELARFEERYFADDEVFAELELEEDELIDAYVKGGLTRRERKSFERAMHHSGRLRERIAFGEMLLAKTSPRLSDSKAPWRLRDLFVRPALLATASASLVALVAMSFLSVEWVAQRNESQRLLAERSKLEQQQQQLKQRIQEEDSKAQQLNDQVKNQKQELEKAKRDLEKVTQELEATKQQLAQRPLEIPSVAAISLLPGSSRGGSEQELTVKPSEKLVKLDLGLDSDDYPKYRVSIMSADGRQPIVQAGLRAHGPTSSRVVSLKFPKSRLGAGDYVVSVSGLSSAGGYDPVADYRFRLIKK